MMKSKELSLTDKFLQKAIRATLLEDLMGWPPFCNGFDYQPRRPDKPLPKPQDKK